MPVDDGHAEQGTTMPVGPRSFPRAGVNALAGLGARGVARALDWLLIGIPYSIVAGMVILVANGGDPAATETMDGSAREYVAMVGPFMALLVVYETVAVTLWGQTLGKAALGIRVARQVNGRCPLWWEAALRVGIVAVVAVIPHPIAPAVALCLYTTAGFDAMRRNITDRVAGTVVVRTR